MIIACAESHVTGGDIEGLLRGFAVVGGRLNFLRRCHSCWKKTFVD